MAFAVGDPVVAQKMGGQTGNKKISPQFQGVVAEVLGGGAYRVDFHGHKRQKPQAFFRGCVVLEAELTAG